MNNASETDKSTIEDEDLDMLEQLLADESDKSEATISARKLQEKAPKLNEDSSFAAAFEGVSLYKVSVPYEDVDSSDEEELKNFLERKYNEYGRDVNQQLKQKNAEKREQKVEREVQNVLQNSTSATSTFRHLKNSHNPVKRISNLSSSFQQEISTPVTKNVTPATSTVSTTFTDPVFGLRIINPLVSSALLVERMAGRKALPFSQIVFHTQRGDLSKDWVIAGVLVNKSPSRSTKNGQPYSIWHLSDLRGEIKMISLFLFRGAHKELWKTAPGMCVAVLNPSVFEKRAENGDLACLSIDTAHKIMILGQSKDLGTCKARKRNGDACTTTVNLSECDYCIFHMKQEYNKMSRRSELQSATTGRGLQELRNKVLGKNEVFYGGQSFTAVRATKSAKLTAKDSQRLSSLSEYAVSPFASSTNHTSKPKTASASVPYATREGPVSRVASNMEIGTKQRLKDLERLKALQAEGDGDATINTSTPKAESSFSFQDVVPTKFKDSQFSFTSRPTLSSENFSLEVTVGERQANFAKLKAAQLLKKSPVVKSNPNSTRGSVQGKRRAIDELNEKFANHDAKRQKVTSETTEATECKSRIQRIMAATSSHANLIDMRDQEAQDQYFRKLEKKEAMEEKMLNTFKMPCKAVICQRCKYTAFSAAERCKQEQHPLKVVDAEKRFFRCKDCGNRTASVFKLPKTSCKNCKGSRWERAAMIRERKVCTGADELSVRGDEEVFLGSLAGKANVNLLVPTEAAE